MFVVVVARTVCPPMRLQRGHQFIDPLDRFQNSIFLFDVINEGRRKVETWM